MGHIALLPQGSQCRQAGQTYLEEIGLPTFYMGDHSIMALLVEKFEDAVRLLQKSGYLLSRKKSTVEVGTTGPEQVKKLFQLLEDNLIQFEMRDIFARVYQG